MIFIEMDFTHSKIYIAELQIAKVNMNNNMLLILIYYKLFRKNTFSNIYSKYRN